MMNMHSNTTVRRCLITLLCLMTAVASAFAQSDKDTFKKLYSYVYKTSVFNQKCPQEKVYLHFDNTAYFQGDVIWFSAWVINASTGQPAPSRVLYVDLMSPTGVLLNQLKLKVVDGRCHGSFPLVDRSTQEARELRGVLSYPSGYYEVRAYTMNMLNFGEQGIFSRVFPVYEAPKEEGNYENPVLNASIAPWVTTNRPKQEKEQKVNVTFYPEGGNLVQGLSCRVAFKAVDEKGQGIPVLGTVKDEKGEGDDLALLTTLHDGMGYFTFTPTRKRHVVNIVYEGKTYSFRLPEALSTGSTLLVDASDSLSLRGRLSMKTSRKQTNPLIGVSLMSRGIACYFDTLRLVPSVEDASLLQTTFAIPSDDLPTGVHQLTLFTEEGEVLAQRMAFINNGISSAHVDVTSDKRVYQPFDPINLQLSATDVYGKPLQTNLSVAVRDGQNLGTAYQDNMLTNLLLSSELKGFINQPEWYFESKDRLHRQSLDLLMMTQGWTRYNWRQMSMVEPFTIKHYVENGLVLDGVMLTRRTGKPLAGASLTMKLYSRDRQFSQQSTVVTDAEGRFGFAVEDFDSIWDMFLTAKHKNEPVDVRLRLDRADRPAPRAYVPTELFLPEYATLSLDDDAPQKPVPEWMQQANTDLVFHLDEVEVEGNRKYIDYMTFKAFDAEEDTEYQLDCGRFTYKVADYLKEKGYDLDVSRYDGVVDSSITTRDEFISWTLDQCLLNNHRVLWYLHDEHRNLATTAYIPGFDMDMEDIKSIIVYDSPTIFESMPIVRETLTVEQLEELRKRKTLSDGTPVPAGLYVIDISMYPLTERKTRTKGTRQTTFRGYSEVTEFYAPEYPDGPIPGDKDYRRTLYWNPSVETDAQGQAHLLFYNNGTPTHPVISAEGLTSTGTPVL